MTQVVGLAQELSEYARDVKLNVKSVLVKGGAVGLEQTQIWLVGLASSYAIKNRKLTEAFLIDASRICTHEQIEAAKITATIMAMNNVYYRFIHLLEDKELSQMPPRLRMNAMANPGVSKIDFELMSLAVSALAGCPSCINGHVGALKAQSVSNEAIQSSVRIASIMNSLAQALEIGP